MADGWRNRNLAPLYALVISFVLVLLFGAVLPTPEADQTAWKFQVPRTGEDGAAGKTVEAPEEFAAFAIWGDHVRSVGHLKELDDLDIDSEVTVCVIVESGWIMEEQAGSTAEGYTCSQPLAPDAGKNTVKIKIVPN
jgi:hypothetical protein